MNKNKLWEILNDCEKLTARKSLNVELKKSSQM